jgi:peptidyl-prolyl cis-trans isomerase B (cyclophilin B)
MRRMMIAAVVATGILLLRGACTMAAETNKVAEVNKAATTDKVAVIETKFGKMVVAFYDKDAPNTIANFQKLASQGFYDGTTFHRIVKGFMIQGGDPLSKDPNNEAVGTGGPGYQIKAEFNTNQHVLGVISMARSSDPDSAGSQFFICLGNAAFLNGQYTAFGKLIAGEDVLKKIGDMPTKMDRFGREPSVPEERVVIEKIKITTREEALKK